jgi:hypothetical protein
MRHRENTESLIDMKQVYEYWGNTWFYADVSDVDLLGYPAYFPTIVN